MRNGVPPFPETSGFIPQTARAGPPKSPTCRAPRSPVRRAWEIGRAWGIRPRCRVRICSVEARHAVRGRRRRIEEPAAWVHSGDQSARSCISNREIARLEVNLTLAKSTGVLVLIAKFARFAILESRVATQNRARCLLAIHEHLTRIPKRQPREVGWTKARELVKLARREEAGFDFAPWVHSAKVLPKEEFKREVERYLTGKETAPWVLIYFKLYRSQLPVVERALEIAARMLGSDKFRGFSLEMICADFLAGAALEMGGSQQNLGCSASSDYSFAASEQPASTQSSPHE